MADQSGDDVERSKKLRILQEEYHERLQRARASALLLKLVDALFASPAVTIGGTARMLKVTHRAATLNVGTLVDAGILGAVTGRARNRVFVARGIVRAVEEDL